MSRFYLTKLYIPSDTEKALDGLASAGQHDETGGVEGEQFSDDVAARASEPPEDPIAYRDECEAMGR